MSFIIEKEEPNVALWEEVLTLSKGSVKQKAQAADLIFQHYSVLPKAADDLLKKFTLPEAPVTLRRRIAVSLSKRPRITWSLYSTLVSNLSKSKDEKVNSALKSDFERYSTIQKSLESYVQQQQQVFIAGNS